MKNIIYLFLILPFLGLSQNNRGLNNTSDASTLLLKTGGRLDTAHLKVKNLFGTGSIIAGVIPSPSTATRFSSYAGSAVSSWVTFVPSGPALFATANENSTSGGTVLLPRQLASIWVKPGISGTTYSSVFGLYLSKFSTAPGGGGNTQVDFGLSNATDATNDIMTLRGDGTVGINNTTPTEKLDVTGNVRFSGALMPNNTAGTSGQVLTSAGAGVVPTWTTNTSESTTIGAFQSSGNSNGLTLSGTDIRLHAATISTPGAVNVGQQTFSSGADTKIFTGTGSRQLTVDGDTDNTAAGISFTQLGGTDEIAYISANSSDASNGAMRILLEEGAALTEYINIGTANDTKGIFERGGLYETVTTVTTTPYTIAYGDRNVYLNGTSITVNLQGIGGSAGQTKIGRVIYLFNDNATSVTVTPNGSDTINDAASLTLSANTGVTLLAVATNIWVTRD